MSTTESTKQPLTPHKFNVALGVIGLSIAIAGNFIPTPLIQKWFYFISAILLFVSAFLERQMFFILLEVIIVAGTAIAFTDIGIIYKSLLPILLSIGVIIYFLTNPNHRNFHTMLGSLGIAFLAAGYAVLNPIIYLLGGVILAIYSWQSYQQGIKIALIWAILNVVFAITALVSIYHSLIRL